MNKLQTIKHEVIWKSSVDLALEIMQVKAAPMPNKPSRSNLYTRIKTTFFVSGATFIVLLYVALPLVTALHKFLYPVAQDFTLVIASIIEIAIFITLIIMKTDGR